MLTELEICNLALSRIGQREIADLNEVSAEAVACKRHYSIARDSLLRSYWWNFAKSDATLTLAADKPAEWGFAFDLPDDLIAARYVVPPIRFGRKRVAYEIAGRKLWTDENEVSIIYTRKVTDPTLFDSLFVRSLFHRLAADMVGPLTLDPRKSQIEEQMFLASLAEARATDAIEEAPFNADELGAAWLDARG